MSTQARSPVTPTKGLRDRIAKFEGSEGTVLKSNRSPKASRMSKDRPSTATSRIPSLRTSSQPGIVETLKLDTTLPIETNVSKGATTPENKRTGAKVDEDGPLNANSPNAASAGEARDKSLDKGGQPSMSSEDTALATKQSKTSVESSPLDALLSPTDKQTTQVIEVKDFHTGSLNEEEEDADNVRFSMVPLSGKAFDESGKATVPRTSFSSGTPSVDGMDQLEDITGATLNNKPVNRDALEALASPRTLFFRNRLEKQEEAFDLSLGSNRQFQAELSRLQSENTTSQDEAEHIDWG